MKTYTWVQRNVKRACKERGMRMGDIAEDLDVTRQMVHHWMRYICVPPDDARDYLAELIGCEKELIDFVYGIYPDKWCEYAISNPTDALAHISRISQECPDDSTLPSTA